MQQHFSVILCGLDIKTRQKLSILSTTTLADENLGMDFSSSAAAHVKG